MSNDHAEYTLRLPDGEEIKIRVNARGYATAPLPMPKGKEAEYEQIIRLACDYSRAIHELYRLREKESKKIQKVKEAASKGGEASSNAKRERHNLIVDFMMNMKTDIPIMDLDGTQIAKIFINRARNSLNPLIKEAPEFYVKETLDQMGREAKKLLKSMALQEVVKENDHKIDSQLK